MAITTLQRLDILQIITAAFYHGPAGSYNRSQVGFDFGSDSFKVILDRDAQEFKYQNPAADWPAFFDQVEADAKAYKGEDTYFLPGFAIYKSRLCPAVTEEVTPSPGFGASTG